MDASDTKHLTAQQDLGQKLPHLENWTRWDRVILGNVFNRPPFPDGELIYTSRVIWLKGDRVQTKNTLYTLGKEGR